jgi:hypothetical protein
MQRGAPLIKSVLVSLLAPAVLFSSQSVAAESIVSAGAAKCGAIPPSITNFGTVVADNSLITPGHYKTVPAPAIAMRYRRLLIAKNSQSIGWTLRIYDGFGRPLEAINSDSVSDIDEFWTKRLTASTVSLTLDGGVPPPDLSLVERLEMPKSGSHQYYSTKLQGNPDWQRLYGGGVSVLKTRVGEAVGMIFASMGTAATGYSTWSCSGFVVPSKYSVLFITAAHCGAPEQYKNLAWSNTVLRRAFVDLSWDGDEVSREFRIKGPPYVDANLDLAVMQIVSTEGNAPPLAVNLRDGPPQIGEPLFMIHHPESAEKQISDFNCLVESLLGKSGHPEGFTHKCDAESGSSGSPIFDQTGVVVGIHLLGYQIVNGKCDGFNKAISSQTASNFIDKARTAIDLH